VAGGPDPDVLSPKGLPQTCPVVPLSRAGRTGLVDTIETPPCGSKGDDLVSFGFLLWKRSGNPGDRRRRCQNSARAPTA
jgi:hypothetical protein